MAQPIPPPSGGNWFTRVGCILFIIMASVVITVAFLAARENRGGGPLGVPDWFRSWLAGPPTPTPTAKPAPADPARTQGPTQTNTD